MTTLFHSSRDLLGALEVGDDATSNTHDGGPSRPLQFFEVADENVSSLACAGFLFDFPYYGTHPVGFVNGKNHEDGL